MKAFVTGGTGFIGSHLVDTLINEQKFSEIRCLVRNNEKWLKGNDYIKVPGDLHDLNTLKDAMTDVDVIFHAAGVVKAPSWQQFQRANIDATENILRIAQKQGVKKMVILSSLAAAGPSENGTPVSERDPMRPVSMYGRSKKEMEEMIHQVASEEQSITILRPPAVYGPREDQIYSFFKMMDKHICPIIGDGESPKISMVYVMDVILGMLQAAKQQVPGVHTYFISGKQLHTWNEIKETSTKVLGKKAIPIYIKPGVVKKIAGAVEKAASFFGTYPVINREKANELVLEWTCSIDKAQRELNFEPKYTLAEGISRTIHWYKMHHWL
ncbi:NAD-dependent epimerase/dehydratase family protein [Aliifodinibius sp. S!AR15-10]|uniref:NAD-dependent epimerase/dehydratase family protein n=1 Tax=Aliifodinibius sp. S!AR15-10 TaxID=2950437 RepID=UPI0028633EE7|nr:NAD-dependent epimerase/dehydratase family protein [Aliifodinibius sp. S!AR15-10]MDR8393192.1 NAD-dependent epimerase/dehydratase family protein [Aliifodinibius sp. S!AR15-10]